MDLTDKSDRPRQYTVALTKGAAAIEEMRRLLLTWNPGESNAEFLDRVLAGDLLGKQTARRTRDIVNTVFRPRLLGNGGRAACWLRYYLDRSGNREAFREMLFVYAARKDDLLYDFTVERFWPALREGSLLIRPEDVLRFFAEAMEKKRLSKPWSSEVQVRLARGLLGTLRDFGLIRDEKGRRELVPYRMSDDGLAYLAHELHFTGHTDAPVVDSPDWALFGLDRSHLLDRLDGLATRLQIMVQRAGSIVRITWSHPSMEAFIDALVK